MRNAQIPVYMGDSVARVWDNGGTTKDGPGGALTPLFRGLTDQPLEGE